MASRPELSPEYAPPGETPADLWVERSNLAGIVIAGVAYGILFTIFMQCILSLRTSNPHKKRQARWLAAYSCVIFILATCGFAANVKFIQMTFIDYRNYPGGPNAFTFDFYTDPVNMFSLMCYVIMNWFADGLMLYRFTVFYNGKSWLLLVFPCMLYLAIIGLSLAMAIYTMNPSVGFWAPITINIGTAYWSISIGLNIIVTVAIAGRLLKMRANIRKILGPKHSSPYTSVLAMIIESAALYTSWALIFMVAYAKGDTFQNVVLSSLGQVQGIAPLLIIFRVAQGKAWTTSTGTSTMSLPSAGSRPTHPSNFTGSTNTGATRSFPLTDATDSTVHLDIKVEKSTVKSQDSRWV